MSETPRLGLLLDVDGPIASPITRTVAIPSIADDLVAIANAGNPVVFNTGRSDAFIRDVVIPALVDAGLEATAPVHAVCEKGGSWFSLDPAAADLVGTVQTDPRLQTPAEFGDFVRAIVTERYRDLMFFDETKLTMISVEQNVGSDSAAYREAQTRFDAEALAYMEQHGLTTDFRIDPTIISTDIEHRETGKDLGARRALELISAHGPLPRRWYTAGDSRSDYAMADALHELGYEVEHLDVRPLDGVPATPYPVLRAADDAVIHDEATAEFLGVWRAEAH
ncbi:hypothetical protein GCM10027515_22590 [Schumannella luteola]|uniref:Hydroxymethylpyrimidine pyrophosphatase n=1 Tax=Schumannella luteola TaxID=472059 RepID=A0A852YRR8_9MICO|nr:hypothetical protein [Schumannella luteola]TPX05510.1 hypothetical protein FJ656_06370 [Schumannella luteola]